MCVCVCVCLGVCARGHATICIGLMEHLYLTLIQLLRSDQRVTLGNIIDGGGVPFLGAIAAMEIYAGITEGVPGPIKKEVMKALCRDDGVAIGQLD